MGQFSDDMKKYKVLLVDDHPIVVEGLGKLVRDPFDVVECCSSAEQALLVLAHKEIDVLITDYEMPKISGIELVKAARAAHPDLKIIVLSMHDDPSVVRELLRSGVNGYILKKDSHKILNEALHKVADNKRYLSDEISEILINADKEEERGPLTAREIEIIKLIAKEFNSRQIAEILFISERTVETHRKNILRKTGANNLAGLIMYAFQNRII